MTFLLRRALVNIPNVHNSVGRVALSAGFAEGWTPTHSSQPNVIAVTAPESLIV
jgi:hypothetical protein